MKVRKAIKRIIALGTGLTMLGATVFGAVAADLGEYPSQFIEDGAFDGLMVVGAKAKTEDVLGIVDIATSLQFSAKKEVGVEGTTTTTLSGDVYKIGSTSDILELNEYLGDVDSTLTEDDLAMLGSRRISTAEGSTDSDQYLEFNKSQDTGLRVVNAKDSEEDLVDDYMWVDDGAIIFNYELQFPEGLESDAYDETTGSTTETRANNDGTVYLQDVEEEIFFMLGQDFSVVEAKLSDNISMELTMMGGAVHDTLKEGETKTYDIDGTPFEVTVVIIADSNDANDESRVKLMINGEVTKQLNEGDTDTLDDGTVVGIDDVLANEGAEEGGEDIVSFYIGANKVVLSDTDMDDDNYNSGVEIDEESIEDASVKIKGTYTGDEVTISSVSYKLAADSMYSGDIYVPAGKGVREYLDEQEGMLSDVWDIKFMGMSQPETTILELAPSGDDAYSLSFETAEGYEYSFSLVDNRNGVTFNIGEEVGEEDFIYTEATQTAQPGSITEDDYFLVSTVADQDDAQSRVLSWDSIDSSEGILEFSDLADGSSYEVSYTPGDVVDNTALEADTQLVVGGESYEVWLYTTDNSSDNAFTLHVDLTGDGNPAGGDRTNATLKGGAILAITGENASEINMSLTVLEEFIDGNNTDEVITWEVFGTDATDENVGIRGFTGVNLDSDKGSDVDKGRTPFGTTVELDDEADDEPETMTVAIPAEQVEALVYVTGGESSASTVGGNTITEVQRIQVGKSVLDNEVTNVAADNLIVVGGPCVNSVAATLLGISGSAPGCYENFPVDEGQGIIKIVENGEKVAVLVAGYSAADTRNAAQVLANYGDYAADLAGKDEVVVSGTQIMAAQVAPEPVEAPADDGNMTE